MRMPRVEISCVCCDWYVMVRALTTLMVLSAVYSMHKEGERRIGVDLYAACVFV